MATRQQVIDELDQRRIHTDKEFLRDPEVRAVLLEIVRDAGSAERIAVAEAAPAPTPRWPMFSYREHEDDAGTSIFLAVLALACEGEAPPVLLRVLGDPLHVIRYAAACALEGRIPVHDALMFLRAEARYGMYKAIEIGLAALTTAEDLRALLGSVPPEDLPFAVVFLGFHDWSDPMRQEANRLLREHLSHPDERVRAAAALTSADAEEPAVRAALRDAIRVPEPWIRNRVIERLVADPAEHPLSRAAL